MLVLLDFVDKSFFVKVEGYNGFGVGAYFFPVALCPARGVYSRCGEKGVVVAGLGCNVENAALGDTICAERTACVKAVSEGYRKFVRIAIYAESQNYCMPCGSSSVSSCLPTAAASSASFCFI